MVYIWSKEIFYVGSDLIKLDKWDNTAIFLYVQKIICIYIF